MNSAEALKIKAASLDFCGNVRQSLNEILLGIEHCQDGRIKAIKKFCDEAEKRLSDLIFETEYRSDGDIIQDKFINQVRAIKKLCEKAMKQ